ncbi:MAG: c-type cytochrome [Hyphomicrobiales bacterium]|nr:c-type cytochrome [Hyphomicrobiales bacterium]
MKTAWAKGAVVWFAGAIMFGMVAGCTPAMSQAAPGKPDAGRGEVLAQKLCATCHIPDGNAARLQGTADVPTFPEIARAQGQNADRIHGILILPSHPMPTISLTKNEMADLAAYILSLK